MAINRNIHFFDSFLCRKIPSLSPGGNVASAEMEGGFSITAADVLKLSLWERNPPANVTLLLAMESVVQQWSFVSWSEAWKQVAHFPKKEQGGFLDVLRCLKIRYLEVSKYLVLGDEGNENSDRGTFWRSH